MDLDYPYPAGCCSSESKRESLEIRCLRAIHPCLYCAGTGWFDFTIGECPCCNGTGIDEDYIPKENKDESC